MMVNDILFQTHLNYQIDANTPQDEDDSISMKDISQIDLHHCLFADFLKVLSFMRDNNPDMDYSDFSIDAIKPAGFVEDMAYDFVELTDYAKHTAITIGNMALFSDLQKISSAIESFNLNANDGDASEKIGNVYSFNDYDNYEIKDNSAIFQEIGSCVVGGGNDEAIKLTASFHGSSTIERPIISIRSYSLSTNMYLTNQDIIDITGIYKPNASIMEVFAYLSYYDYKHDAYNQSFDKLLIGGDVTIDNLDDMYAKSYDLSAF